METTTFIRHIIIIRIFKELNWNKADMVLGWAHQENNKEKVDNDSGGMESPITSCKMGGYEGG